MNVIKDVIQELKHNFSHANKEGVNYPVRLFTRSDRLEFKTTLKLAQWIAIISAVGGFMLYNTMGTIGIVTIFLGCAFAVYLIVRRLLPERKLRFREYEGTLTNFIIENGLYEEANGKIVRQIDMSYTVFPRILSVYVTLHGDCYQSIAEKLAEPLQSTLGLEFHKMLVVKGEENFVEYMFRLEPAERYTIGTTMPLEDPSTTIEVYDEFKLDLTKNCSALIAGVSGTGKSYLAYYLITSYLARRINSKAPSLYLVDPKRSDLFILARNSFMESRRYGDSIADAFRIVKDFKKEIDRRQVEYSEKAVIGSTMLDLGAEPALLVIDEYASLIAGMTNKEKTDFENLLASIVQRGRQLSCFVWVLMQQPRADLISTNIRENLPTKICMGNPTVESSKMLFGTTDVPVVNGIGAGLYSFEGGKVQRFEAPRFEGDFDKIIIPVWECANLSRKYAMDETDEKKEPTSEVDWEQFL